MSSPNPKEMEEAIEEKQEEVIQTPDRALKYTLFFFLVLVIIAVSIVGYALAYAPRVTNTKSRWTDENPYAPVISPTPPKDDWKPETIFEKAMVLIGGIILFAGMILLLFSGRPDVSVVLSGRATTLSDAYLIGIVVIIIILVLVPCMFLFDYVVRKAEIAYKKEQ